MPFNRYGCIVNLPSSSGYTKDQQMALMTLLVDFWKPSKILVNGAPFVFGSLL